MNKKGTLLFLGTGGSLGIPVIGCSCPVCRSPSPYNKRLRPSVLVKVDDKRILIDCGQDFRYQALHHKIDRLDGVILTHSHHDHTAGVDDLRVYQIWSGVPLPCLVSKETEQDLRIRYHYIFKLTDHPEKLIAKIDLRVLEGERGQVDFAGLPLRYFTYKQTGMKVTGIRMGNAAYVSDIKEYPETIFEDLKGIEILIISALRFTPSHIHFTVDEAVEFSQKVGAKETWLTHIAHDLDHDKTNAYLPPNVRMAYDTLEIPFEI